MESLALENSLLALRSIGLKDLRRVLRRLGRPEANARTVDDICQRLREALRKDEEPQLMAVFAALEQLSKLECVDTCRIRAIFLDPAGRVPVNAKGQPFFVSKDAITGASRRALLSCLRDLLLFSQDTAAALRQVQFELEAHGGNFSIGDNVMFVTESNANVWRRGVVIRVAPLQVHLPDLTSDQENIDVIEACSEETYYAAEIKKAYRAADQNDDGILEREELIRVMRALGFTKTNRELEAMFYEMDTDKNGFVDFDEFVDWVMGDRPIQDSVTNAKWVDGIKEADMESSERVPMKIHDAGYLMCGPGVEIMGMRAGYEGELDMLAVSEQAIYAPCRAVSGVAFESHGYGFQVCFATAEHRWAGTDEVEFGIYLVNKETEPYEYNYFVHAIEMGNVLGEPLAKYRCDGRTTSSVMVNSNGKFELRHNGKTCFVSRRTPRYPLFVKVFSCEKGPLLQDLRWIDPAGKSARDVIKKDLRWFKNGKNGRH